MPDTLVAIVTAASRGMAHACARELARTGYFVVLMSTSDGAASLATDLGGVGMRGSVTEPADLERLVALAMNEHGRIDAVVNNTGHAPKDDLLALTDDDWHAGLDMAMLNVVRMARLVTPIMLDAGAGSVVNISTYAAFEPEAAFPVSAAMRAALAGFVKVYADQYAANGIRMNNVLPGFIDSYPAKEPFLKRIPMERYGTVDEIARTVRFLLSEDASYITGQNIRVDGGITRSV